MRTILHLSDLHIQGKKRPDEQVVRLFQKVMDRWSTGIKPLVIITGDIVDNGTEKEFKAARDLLAPLREKGFPLYLVPGNHDYGWHGSIAQSKKFKLFKKYLYAGQNISYPMTPPQLEDMALIGLNSMAAELDLRKGGLLANGELGKDQINFTIELIDQIKAQSPNKKIVLFLHHHPFIFPKKSWIEKVIEYAGHHLKDGNTFMKRINGKVDMLLFGHDHLHINFSKGSKDSLAEKYNIPVILSCGSIVVNNSLPGWVIENGKVSDF